jgi:hypothetical protein
LCALLALGAEPVRAEQDLDPDRPEGWALFHFTSLTLFSGLGTPQARSPGSIEAGLELGSVPHLNEEQRTVGFDGTKEEDLNQVPLFARPYVTIGLPWKLSLTLSYVPPVQIFGVKPHLGAIAIGRPIYERDAFTVGIRGYGQIGQVEGAFTCPGDAADEEPGSPGNLYGCEKKSDDQILMRYLGLEAGASYRLDVLRDLTPYLTMGVNYIDSEFHTHAVTFGAPDNTRLESDGYTFSMGAGFRIPITGRIDFAVGALFSPLWVKRAPSYSRDLDEFINARSSLSYRFR